MTILREEEREKAVAHAPFGVTSLSVCPSLCIRVRVFVYGVEQEARTQSGLSRE